MIEYRVTKYDPALRDARGAYLADDWTAVSDIGKPFGGTVLTEAEYRRVERAYIGAALAFLEEAGISSLVVEGLENHAKLDLPFAEGSVLGREQLGEVIGRILREEFWCRLECERGYVHFGYDYYMFVCVPQRCPAAESRATELGLYAEPFDLPESADTVG